MHRGSLERTTLLFSVCALWACGAGPNLSSNQEAVTYSQNQQCVALIAGQNINAGSVCVSVSGSDLVVTYDTTGGWQLTEAQLWVGDSLTTMPQTKTGNPQVGLFPYKSGDITGDTSYTFDIPLSSLSTSTDLCGHTFDVAAHAALQLPLSSGGYNTQTGWGAGTAITSRGNWGTYFSYTVQCDTTPPPPPPALTCQTGFGFGQTTFVQLGLTSNRWGWEIGPISAGSSVTEPVYAGAAQNDISKGTLVGSVTVSYDGSTVDVNYSMDSGDVLEATHVYAGTSPTSTMDPGQYGNIHDPLNDVSSDSYSIGGFSGQPVYVVAHAVVCN